MQPKRLGVSGWPVEELRFYVYFYRQRNQGAQSSRDEKGDHMEKVGLFVFRVGENREGAEVLTSISGASSKSVEIIKLIKSETTFEGRSP